MDLEENKRGSFLIVLTGTELAYHREDDVYIVPIGYLTD